MRQVFYTFHETFEPDMRPPFALLALRSEYQQGALASLQGMPTISFILEQPSSSPPGELGSHSSPGM